MKKTFTCSLALALCFPLGAEELKILSLGSGTPGIDEPSLNALGISANGRFVCGSIEYGEGVFVLDVENGVGTCDVFSDSELRRVDNNGLAIGFMGDEGVAFSLDYGKSILPVPTSTCKYILGEDLSNDGSIKIGSLVEKGFVTIAAYSENDGEWSALPMPPAELLGQYREGSSAKGVSGDGKYIIGHAGSFGPIVMWTRNADGSYEADALFSKFCALTQEELKEKPLVRLSPVAISNNGLYVLCGAAQYVIDEAGFESLRQFPAVYNTETHELKHYNDQQEIDYADMGLSGTAIADDGTFVGIIGQTALLDCAGAFILKAGETQAQSFNDVFPEYAEMLEFSDISGYSIPVDISADGGSILGYAFYSEDFYDDMLPAYYISYIIKTEGEGSAVDSVGVVSSSDEIYSLDGIRLTELNRGLNIVRSADGSVRKLIKK